MLTSLLSGSLKTKLARVTFQSKVCWFKIAVTEYEGMSLPPSPELVPDRYVQTAHQVARVREKQLHAYDAYTQKHLKVLGSAFSCSGAGLE